MRFRQFYLITEADPAGPAAPPSAAATGGDPMGGGMGMPPSPAPSMGGIGGDPMGGGMGMPPMGGGSPAVGAQPTIPQHADVWDVLDSILNHKSMPQQDDQTNNYAKKPSTNNVLMT